MNENSNNYFHKEQSFDDDFSLSDDEISFLEIDMVNLGLTFAKGGVFNNGLVKEYAKGGIVTQPRLFKYASGGTGNFGLMGEAGAEAILPLKRGRSGNLGVESSGGGSTNIVINVDATGSSVEGNTAQSNDLANVFAQAIQAELIAQKRAGGLLSNA